MFKKNNRYKLLKIFLDKPLEGFRLRELGRLSKISPASVLNYLKDFEETGFIEKQEDKGYAVYKSNRDGEKFIFYKKLSILYELEESGLINFLWEEVCPSAIILYGSHVKGESIEESDIDIFLIGKKVEVSVSEFEEKLGKEIHLMFDDNPKKIPKALRNNLINGIVLRGYFTAL